MPSHGASPAIMLFKARSAVGWLVLLAVLLLSSLAIAAELPKLTGRVVDDAGMIDAADEAALTQKLEAFEKKSTDQIVVATIESLNGEEIEPYANRLFREWHLGQANENNGILLLVAKSDRKVRIEVGYGLEGTLTDLHSKLIIENTIVPAFRAGDFSGGISRAVDDIIMVLEGNAAELEARYKRNQPSAEESVDWVAVVFVTLFLTIFLFSIGMSILPPMFGKKIGRNRYRWLGREFVVGGGSSSSGWSSGSGGGWSSGGGGFSGGGGSSGGGGASGSW